MRAFVMGGALALFALFVRSAEQAHAAPQPDVPVDLKYFGGPVVSSAVLHAVYWGPNVDPAVTGAMPTYLSQLATSSWWDILTEYSTAGKTAADGNPGSNQTIGHGSFGQQVTMMPSNTSATVSNSDVATELASQIGAGKLPAVTYDSTGNPNTIYVVFFPSTVTLTDGSGATACSAFCAMHSSVTYMQKQVPFVMVPDLTSSACMSACRMGSLVEDIAVVTSYEITECVTDPEISVATAAARPLAWYDPNNGEVAGVCSGEAVTRATVSGVSQPVRRIWSLSKQACEPSLVATDGGAPDAMPADAGAADSPSDALADATPDATFDAPVGADASDWVAEPGRGLWCAFARPAPGGSRAAIALAALSVALVVARRRRRQP